MQSKPIPGGQHKTIEAAHGAMEAHHQERTSMMKTPLLKSVGEHGVTQPIPRESMRETMARKPSVTPLPKADRPGAKPILPDISKRKTSVLQTPASTAQTQKMPVLKALLVKSTGEGSRGGKVLGHTKTGHPIYGHADHTKISEGGLKKLKSGVKAYNKHLDALESGDRSAYEAARKARDKLLFKVVNSAETTTDNETASHLANHIEGSSSGALRKLGDAEEKGRAKRAEASHADLSRLKAEERDAHLPKPGESHYEAAARQNAKEMSLMRIKR